MAKGVLHWIHGWSPHIVFSIIFIIAVFIISILLMKTFEKFQLVVTGLSFGLFSITLCYMITESDLAPNDTYKEDLFFFGGILIIALIIEKIRASEGQYCFRPFMTIIKGIGIIFIGYLTIAGYIMELLFNFSDRMSNSIPKDWGNNFGSSDLKTDYNEQKKEVEVYKEHYHDGWVDRTKMKVNSTGDAYYDSDDGKWHKLN